jgi:hypothetical protein
MVSRFVDVPELYHRFLRPQKMSFNTKGGSISGGVNGIGEAITIEMTGGGIVTASYEECFVFSPEQHEYVNYLAARLNRGTRFIAVPIFNDWAGPFARVNGVPIASPSGIPHSDGSGFSDGALGYSQASVWGRFHYNTALNAGQITIRVYNTSRGLRWSDWFSVLHNQNGDLSKGWRAYRYWESEKIDEGTEPIDGAGNVPFKDYILAITPPLREAVVAGTRIEFAKPRFVGKFATGFELSWDVEGYWQSRPTLQFVEAF